MKTRRLVELDSERLDHSEEERIFMNDGRSLLKRLARAVLVVVASRPDDPEDVARFQASLKVATHVAISILVVFPFTWTVPRWPSRGFEQRPSFVTVADLQPCLLYLQPSEPTTNPNLMSRFILPFLRRATSPGISHGVAFFSFYRGDRCASPCTSFISRASSS